MFRKFVIMFDASAAGGTQSNDASDTSTETEEKASAFSTWLATQPAEVKAQYEEHVRGLTSALKKERENAKNVPELTRKLQTLQQKEADLAKAQMTKEEQLSTELAQSKAAATALKQAHDQLLIRTSVEREAVKLKVLDPDDVYKLIDSSSVTIDEAGKVVGATEAVKELVKAKPYLVNVPAKETNSKEKIGNVTGKRIEGKDEVKTVLPSISKL